jgi:hypothetical protein
MEYQEPQQAFEAAIQLGLLSTLRTAPNFAGRFMYMGTDEERGHAFKHIDTREYFYTGD